MNFKEALIAHLNGEKVECIDPSSENTKYIGLLDAIGSKSLRFLLHSTLDVCRIAPRTITVNGVEVPAPESVGFTDGRLYFVAAPHVDFWAFASTWSGSDADKDWLERGLVYLNKEDAIARAKAMLLTQE